MTSPTDPTPASPARAEAHFAALLDLETDCWDVHEAMQNNQPGFVVLDVRSPELYNEGHVPGAVSLPHGRIVERNLSAHEPDTVFVVYCAGPHCNGADKAALRLARLGRPVKKMIGGVTGWIDEGFELVATPTTEQHQPQTESQMDAPSSATELHRLPERGRHDRSTIDAIIDEALVCHVGISTEDGPVVIPTLHARIGDQLVIHGSAASRLLRQARDRRICVTITHLDGLVLARTAFHHSANYRSVVIFGEAGEIEDLAERDRALDALVERLVPGRMADLRPNNEKELRSTRVLRIPLDEASAKIRSGGPNDDAEDYERPIWAGVVPVTTTFGPPITDPGMTMDVAVPDYAADYRRPAGLD